MSQKLNMSVIITDAIKDMTGNSTVASPFYSLTAGNKLEQLATDAQIPGKVTLAWTFTTSSTEDVLNQTRAIAQKADIPSIALSKLTLGGIDIKTVEAKANVYTGSLNVPYYLLAPVSDSSADKKKAVLEGSWKGGNGSILSQQNRVPIKNKDVTIPILATIPINGTSPYPVVIFQHGITGNRSHLSALADNLAAEGVPAVAIYR